MFEQFFNFYLTISFDWSGQSQTLIGKWARFDMMTDREAPLKHFPLATKMAAAVVERPVESANPD